MAEGVVSLKVDVDVEDVSKKLESAFSKLNKTKAAIDANVKDPYKKSQLTHRANAQELNLDKRANKLYQARYGDAIKAVRKSELAVDKQAYKLIDNYAIKDKNGEYKNNLRGLSSSKGYFKQNIDGRNYAFNTNQKGLSDELEKYNLLVEAVARYKAELEELMTTEGTLRRDRELQEEGKLAPIMFGIRGSENELDKILDRADKNGSSEQDMQAAQDRITTRMASMSGLGSSILSLSKGLKDAGIAAGEGGAKLLVMSSALSSIAIPAGVLGAVLQPLVNIFKEGFNIGMQFAKSLPSAFAKIPSIINTCVKSVNNLNKGLVNLVKNGAKGIADRFKQASANTDTLQGKLHQLGKMLVQYGLGFRSFLYLYRKVRSQVITGFQEMAKAIPVVNQPLSSAMTSLYQLRAAVATAFQPLLTVAIPALNALISALNNACTAIANFFATLTGQSTIYKAVAVQQDYAKSLDKTGSSAGSAKNQLDKFTVGIDELNVIDPSDSSGGGSDATAQFEEVETQASKLAELLKTGWLLGDLTDFGKELGDRLAKALGSIDWDAVKTKAKKFGSSFATLINGFIKGSFKGKSVSKYIGESLAEALNTLSVGLNRFLEKLDAKALADAILDFFRGAIDKIDWAQFKTTLDTFATRFIQFFEELFSDPQVFADAGEAIGKFFNNLMQSLIKVINNFPYAEAGKAIGAGIRSLFESGITGEQIGTAIANLLNGAMTAGIEVFKQLLASETNLGKEFANAINTIATTFSTEDFQTFYTELGLVMHDIVYDAITGINTDDLLDTLWEVFSGILTGLENFLTGDKESKQGIGDALVTKINEAIQWMKDNFGTIHDKIIEFGQTLHDELFKLFDENSGVNWSDLGTQFGQMFITVLEFAKTVLGNPEDVQKIANAISDFLIGAFEYVATNAEVINGIVNAINDVVSQIANDPEVWKTIETALSSIDWASFLQIGTNIAAIKTQLEIEIARSGVTSVWDKNFDLIREGWDESMDKFAAHASGTVDEYMEESKTNLENHGKELAESTGRGITDNTSYATDAGKNLGTETGKSIDTGLSETMGVPSPEITATTASMLQELALLNLTQALNTGEQIAQSIINGLNIGIAMYKESSLTTVSNWVKEILTKITVGTFDMNVLNAAKFKYIAKQCIDGLVASITENKYLATSAFDTMAKEIVEKFTAPGGAYGGTSDEEGSFYHYGVLVVQGFIDGVNSKKQALIDAMRELGNAANKAFHDSDFEFGSPSKMMRKYGAWTIEGYNEGIESSLGSLTSTMRDVANRIAVPSIVTGQSIPSGLSYSADRTSSAIGTSTSSIIDNGYLGNTEVVAAIQTLTQVVEKLNLNVTLDSKQIESGIRNVKQRRGASIANGGIVNYA